MWPPSRMCGRQRRVIRISPWTFVSSIHSSSSSLDSQNGSRPSAPPALLTRTSSPPSAVDRRGDEALAALGVGDVELRATTSPSSRSTRRAPTATRIPAVTERPRGRGADPAGGAGDDRRLAVEDGTAADSIGGAAASGGGTVGPSCDRPGQRARPGASSARARSARRAAPRAARARAWQSAPARDEHVRRERPGSRSSASRRGGRAPRRPAARPRAPDRPRRGRCLGGETSRKMRVDSRSSPKARPEHERATTRPAIGSKRSQPVTRMSAPATAVPTNAARSVATCRNAPRTFRLSRLARASSAVAARLTATPARATTRTIPPRTSSGETRRRIGAVHDPDAHERRAPGRSACAERISSRRKPYVQRPCAGRDAIVEATSANPSAAASEIRCPASASRASEPATIAGDELARHQRRDQRERAAQQPPIANRRGRARASRTG